MNNDARNLIDAIGALAELCGELYRQLIKNGFSEAEALHLVNSYLIATIQGNGSQE